ncbi:MAG: DUF934 domain-containing protein [Pseudomonadota bacterium]
MSVIVTDTGFGPDTFTGAYIPFEEASDVGACQALDLQPTAEAAEVYPVLGEADLVRIAFPSSADGRGFSIARGLRRLGYTGRLRAVGHVLADQYAMARRAGFDEVEIDDALAARQPEDQWVFRADWQAHDYRARLRLAG